MATLQQRYDNLAKITNRNPTMEANLQTYAKQLGIQVPPKQETPKPVTPTTIPTATKPVQPTLMSVANTPTPVVNKPVEPVPMVQPQQQQAQQIQNIQQQQTPQVPQTPQTPTIDYAKTVQEALNKMNTQPTVTDNTAQITQMYEQKKAADLAALKVAIEKSRSQYQAQIDQAPQQYQPLRDQADVRGAQNLQAIREQMSQMGLGGSGDSVSANVAARSATENDINSLNQQQANLVAQAQRAIADAESAGNLEQARLISDNAAQQIQAIMNEKNRIDEANYQRNQNTLNNTLAAAQFGRDINRDAIADQRYTNEFNYNVGRDNKADQRYTDEFNYNVGRDTVADQRYTDETAYNKQRDTTADQRYAKEFEYQEKRDLKADRNVDRNFYYGVGRDALADQRYTDETTYNKEKDLKADQRYDKEFNYQVGRDKVADERANKQFEESVRQFNVGQGNWQKTFTFNQQQQKIENSLAQGRISNEQAQIALQEAKFKADNDPESVDNVIKMEKARTENAIKTNESNGKKVADYSKYIDSVYYKNEPNPLGGNSGRKVLTVQDKKDIAGYVQNLEASGESPAVIDELLKRYNLPSGR